MKVELTVTPQSLSSNLLSLASLLIIALGVGLIQLYLANAQPWWSSVLTESNASPWRIALGAIIGAFLAGFSYILGTLLWPRDSRWIFGGLAAVRPSWWAATLLSLFAAVFEELLFRAALIPTIGFVAATLLFTMFHYGLYLFAPSVGVAVRAGAEIFFIGSVFGAVYISLGLSAAIACHFVYNMFAFLIGWQSWVQAHYDWRTRNSSAGSDPSLTVSSDTPS